MKIVHVTGSPGSGKTYFAGRVTEWLNQKGEQDRVLVLDLDDINRAFVEANNYLPLLRKEPETFAALYQQHIDELIDRARRNDQSILFVGINSALLGQALGGPNYIAINLQPDFKFALEVPVEVNARRFIQRELPDIVDQIMERLKRDIKAYSPYQENEEEFVRRYATEFNNLLLDFRPSERERNIENDNRYLLGQDFRFYPADKLEKIVEYALVGHL